MISMGESTFFTGGFLEVDLEGETTFSTFAGLGFFMGVCLAGVFLTDFLADLTSDF